MRSRGVGGDVKENLDGDRRMGYTGGRTEVSTYEEVEVYTKATLGDSLIIALIRAGEIGKGELGSWGEGGCLGRTSRREAGREGRDS